MPSEGILDRSIPACAGEPGTAAPPPPCSSVYPRVCGGTAYAPDCATMDAGLSPRVRGNLYAHYSSHDWIGSIPACAGEPETASESYVLNMVYPRVCGGTASGRYDVSEIVGLSPRVRGNPHHDGQPQQRSRSIPACAGEPSVIVAHGGTL